MDLRTLCESLILVPDCASEAEIFRLLRASIASVEIDLEAGGYHVADQDSDPGLVTLADKSHESDRLIRSVKILRMWHP